ncbi:MAG TPA: DoxX family protein [Pseudonocardia sp.]
MTRPLPGSTGDVALLLGRVVLGVVLIAHGWQKIVTNGLGATSAAFGKMGVPLAPVSAGYAGIVELVGGVLLVAGAATVVVSALVVLDMLGAFAIVHVSHGVFAQSGGWELVGVIAAAALLLIGAGAGRYSVDHVLTARRRSAVTV